MARKDPQTCFDFEGAEIKATPLVAWMCVLASGSSGNCTVLAVEHGQRRHVYLIDLGISPRRVRRELAALGLGLDDVEAVFLTHLDRDHWSPRWLGKLPQRATLLLHRRHLNRAHREGALYHRSAPLDGAVSLPGGLTVLGALHAHDSLGVSVLRFDFRRGARSLGFATDVGCVTPDLVAHLAGVDVLAIESNYCPRMQMESSRPFFLKRRIMGGKGHLSNQECAQAVGSIAPREHVVLLHLSRHCNTPELAAAPHRQAPYRVTVTDQKRRTDVIGLVGENRRPAGVIDAVSA